MWRKRIFLFVIPALALLLSGVVLRHKDVALHEVLLLIWATASGILIVYRYNDFACGFSSSWTPVISFFKSKSNTFLVAQFFLIGIPLSWFYLNAFQFSILAISGILGIAYAVNFQWGALSWLPKRRFPIKNMLIGAVWATLFLVGLGQCPDNQAWAMYSFIAVQVFIGSILRDVPDKEHDVARNSMSLPIVVGTKTALMLLHLFNLASLSLTLILPLSDSWDLLYFVFLPVVFWRTFVLIYIQKDPNNLFWTQWANLYTCLLILITTLFLIR